MANAANVTHVGGASLTKNILEKNFGGVVIYMNQMAMQQASSKAANTVISKNENGEKK